MRLKDKHRAPVGGFYYIDGELNKTFRAENIDRLADMVALFRISQKLPYPDNLKDLIEDQICMRQPDGRCWYEKRLGDQVSKMIHATAAVIDRFAGTKLKQRAIGCPACASRRMALNK